MQQFQPKPGHLQPLTGLTVIYEIASSTSIYPADDCTLWYTNQNLASNGDYNWSTRIASFAFPNCTGQSPTQTKPHHGGH